MFLYKIPKHLVFEIARRLCDLYYSNIPTKLNNKEMSKDDWIKARTQELYDLLPQTTIKERNKFTDIRDEIIELNYSFFGYVAKGTYVTDPLATYGDKFQSALANFCEMWAKYKFSPEYSEEMEYKESNVYKYGDYVFYKGKLYECKSLAEVTGPWDKELWKSVKTYRSDLSFAVFFKPRLSECIKRELNTIKYSLRRTVCMKAAAQLGKHWGQITREDLPKIHLEPQEMQILEAIFSTQYDNPYEDDGIVKNKISQSDFVVSCGIDNIYTENYDSLEDLIVHEMIESESKLDDAYLLKMAEMYSIPFDQLVKARPLGEEKLKKKLEDSIHIKEAFDSGDSYGDDSEIDD